MNTMTHDNQDTDTTDAEYLSTLTRIGRRVAWHRTISDAAQPLRKAGMSQAAIAFVLNQRGYRTVTGLPIDQPLVSRILSGSECNQINGGS